MKAKVIGIANEKGGCGKTTTAYHLAVDLKFRGYKSVLIDNDPQKGSYRWKAGSIDNNLTPAVATLENPLTAADLDVFGDCDFIVIDGAPGFGNDVRLSACHDLLNELCRKDGISPPVQEAIRVRIRKIFGFDGTITAKLAAIMTLSDLMIIPTLASLQDLEPSINIIRSLIEPYKQQRGRPEYRVLITDSDERTQLFKEACDFMAGANIPMFSTSIKHREIYRQASARGYTVIENRSDLKASEETTKLTDEVLAILGGNK